MAAALAAVPPSTRDVLLDELATAPRPFPLQPSPSMAPSEHNSALSFASVGEQRVACFVIGGEPRLCFPQVISSCIPGCDVTEVSRLIEDLHIHLGNASQKQIDALKLSDALQQTVSTCVLIKKTDTERLIGELHVAKHGHKVPIDVDKSEMLLVKHDCFGGCKGNLYPSLFPRPCIECVECGNFFEPSHFMTHNHEKGAEILRTVHWGFDANNWRLMIRLRKAQRHCEHAKRAFERFLEPLVVNYLPVSQKRHSSTMVGDFSM